MNALLALRDDIDDFDSFVSREVECIVEGLIRSYLDETTPVKQPPKPGIWNSHRDEDLIIKYRITAPDIGVAEGLSLEEIEDNEEEELPKIKPAKGLTKETLEKDNQLEDPEHEAISDDNEETTFNELFGSAVAPNEEESEEEIPSFKIPELPSTPLRRPYAKKMPKNKARVTECTNARDQESF